MTTKYGQDIEFVQTQQFKPTVKISRLFTALRTSEELKDQIINQNKWIDIPSFNIVESYLTKVETQEFMTVIAECTFDLHAKLLKRGFIIFGIKKSMVHEYVRVLQCGRCWRYGHTGARCSNDRAICRKCTVDHFTSECRATESNGEGFIMYKLR